ncbi:hypothetical protein WKK05_37415 (plasmid) [Nostoc sp. UHCC 0302]|uniref:hypothetical protein n=1 Tax=Nostoc sp. UHCC 0302 TaxID=3134896 RepID=UPI00311CB49F
MITKLKFDNGIALLEKHFRRELCPEAIAIWSEYLNEHLDDQEFTCAVKEAILTLDFFPSAKKLVEFATASYEVQAIADWRMIIRAAKSSNEQWQLEILQPLKERAHVALKAIGGLQPVAMAEEWQLHRLEKQFITVYCATHDNIKFLPPSPPSKQYPLEVIPQSSDSKPIDLSTKSPSIRRVLETLNLRSNGLDIPPEQACINAFARYDWQIDSGRLDYFVQLDKDAKQQFMTKFGFAMRNKTLWRSATSVFDEISGYRVPTSQIDAKAIAREWLAQDEDVEF